MVYIGIDPGKKGGLSIIKPTSDIECYLWDETTFIDKIKNLSTQYKSNEMICCMEMVHSMPTDSHKTAFSFGYQCGFIKAILTAFGVPFQEISPMKWKNEFNLVKKDKLASIAMCKQLYPEVSLLPTSRCKKESDGMAESLLMATYAKRKF